MNQPVDRHRRGHRILEDPFPVRAARTTQANNTFPTARSLQVFRRESGGKLIDAGLLLFTEKRLSGLAVQMGK